MNFKNLSTFIFLASSFFIQAQIKFEKGFFTSKSGVTTHCFIKNVDWKNNPLEFEYRLTNEGVVQKETVQNVAEFALDSGLKYVGAIVKIDRSSNDVNQLSREKGPVFNEEELFLKVLIEGEASLYEYYDGGLIRFFYKMGDSEIQQLVYKRYFFNETNYPSNDMIASNNQFRQQLFMNLKCDAISEGEFEKLKYNRSVLANLFSRYNKCRNANFKAYEVKKISDFIHINIRPGISSNSLDIYNNADNSRDTDFGNKVTFRLGAEIEYQLPFNNGKWSISLEPTYRFYEANEQRQVTYLSDGQLNINVNYTSIEVPVTLRHYFFLKNDTKLFVNASYIRDFAGSSKIDFSRSDGSILTSLELKAVDNFAFGAGTIFKDRYGFEIRYHTNRNVFKSYNNWNSGFNTISAILSYRVF